MRAVAVTVVLVLAAMDAAQALEPLPGSDRWLTNAPSLPGAARAGSIEMFRTLKAEAIANRLRISWTADVPVTTATTAHVLASADTPGHWPARDWRKLSMNRHGTNFQAEVPIDSVHVPLVYGLVISNEADSVASPLRVAQPGLLGLEQPSRIFWPFIEGFEQELDGWRVLHGAPLRTDSTAKHGRSSLLIEIPPGQRSATVATTRLRGWFAQENRARGLELWCRTRRGTGRVAIDLLANAFSTNQILVRGAAVTVGPNWQHAHVRFADAEKFPLAELDLVAIEVTGAPGTEFLVDDVQLTGRWLGF